MWRTVRSERSHAALILGIETSCDDTCAAVVTQRGGSART